MRRTWTDEETNLLKQNYNKLENSVLFALFPNKTPLAITKKALKLGINKSKNLNISTAPMREKEKKVQTGAAEYHIQQKGTDLSKCPNITERTVKDMFSNTF